MDIQQKDNRFFGIFGLSLCVAGMLVPFIIAAIDADDEKAGGFFLIAEILALTFCIIGRKSKPGFVGMIITGVAVVLILALLLMKTG